MNYSQRHAPQQSRAKQRLGTAAALSAQCLPRLKLPALVMVFATFLLTSGCGASRIAKLITSPPDSPKTEVIAVTIECDDDALQHCPPMTTEARTSCAAEIAGAEADMGSCQVCAARHTRLIACWDRIKADSTTR